MIERKQLRDQAKPYWVNLNFNLESQNRKLLTRPLQLIGNTLNYLNNFNRKVRAET